MAVLSSTPSTKLRGANVVRLLLINLACAGGLQFNKYNKIIRIRQIPVYRGPYQRRKDNPLPASRFAPLGRIYLCSLFLSAVPRDKRRCLYLSSPKDTQTGGKYRVNLRDLVATETDIFQPFHAGEYVRNLRRDSPRIHTLIEVYAVIRRG